MSLLLLMLDTAYDYYVDQANGDDANSGTREAPWATLTKLRTTLAALAGERKSAHVAAGAYVDQHLSTVNAGDGGVFEITFAPGCSIVWSLGTDASAIQISGGDNTLRVYGNGLTISGFNAGTGNGLGCFDATLIAYECHVSDCVDGWSAHGAGVSKVYDCTFADCSKSAFAHVGTSVTEAYRCSFTSAADATLGLGRADGGGHTFDQCVFVAADSALGRKFDFVASSTLTRCQIGTASLRVDLTAAAAVTMTDCFVNLYADGNAQAAMVRCYGKLSTRMRDGGNIAADHCVFVGGASGQTASALFRNFDPGSQGDWNVTDCVLTGYTGTAVGNGFGPTDAGYFEAAGNAATYVNYFGNTANIDADLLATSADLSTGVLTLDPELADATAIAAGSVDQADYCVTNAALIGTGSSGGNIGFTAADIA